MLQHLRAQGVELAGIVTRCVRRHSRQVFAQPVAKCFELEMAAAFDRFISCFGIEALGFEEVCVDKAREQHPDEKCAGKSRIVTLPEPNGWSDACRQWRDRLLPAVVTRDAVVGTKPSF